ncbi:MAG: hypothetical protein KVP17_001724 [Porospora cf. gigantea B]|uniref:uncharacterized protein n=1 Tax=Porospora cf. gigantea B TaxID=2853592 RepID=UPI003571947A|nr:MAG: hypothetical protein KVP17_001724 [Porospora cf. gigantea B]
MQINARKSQDTPDIEGTETLESPDIGTDFTDDSSTFRTPQIVPFRRMTEPVPEFVMVTPPIEHITPRTPDAPKRCKRRRHTIGVPTPDWSEDVIRVPTSLMQVCRTNTSPLEEFMEKQQALESSLTRNAQV